LFLERDGGARAAVRDYFLFFAVGTAAGVPFENENPVGVADFGGGGGGLGFGGFPHGRGGGFVRAVFCLRNFALFRAQKRQHPSLALQAEPELGILFSFYSRGGAPVDFFCSVCGLAVFQKETAGRGGSPFPLFGRLVFLCPPF